MVELNRTQYAGMQKSEIPIYKASGKGSKWKILEDKDKEETYSLAIKDPKIRQGWVGDLESKTVYELKDLVLRQEKMIKNRVFLSKLKDGGVHVQKRYEEIKDALQKAQRIEGKKERSILEDPSAYEWNGTMNVKESLAINHRQIKDDLDSDDEEIIPWSTHQINSVPVIAKAKTQLETEDLDPAAMIAQELQRLNMGDAEHEDQSQEEINTRDAPKDFGTKRLIMLEEKQKKNQGKFRTPIKTHRPLATKNTFLPGDQKKHDPRLWDDSVSTDRAGRPGKMISLEESYQLQKKVQERMQARELRDTAERLSRTAKVAIGVPKDNLTAYRDKNEERHMLDSDEEDEDDNNKPGGLMASNENEDDEDFYLH